MKITETAENMLFPKGTYCICCGKLIDNTRTYCLCDHCIRHMDFQYRLLNNDEEGGRIFDCSVAAMGYGVYERRLIFSLKYDGNTYIARIIAHILYDCLRHILEETGECPWFKADVAVPVPVHKTKMRERGFNQAEKIAKHFAVMSKMKTMPDGLIREKETDAQRALSAYERKENMKGAFKANPKRLGAIRDRKVLLIDDIYTTGATARECGCALKQAGAKEVYFLSLLASRHQKT